MNDSSLRVPLAILCAGSRHVIQRLEAIYAERPAHWWVLAKQEYRPQHRHGNSINVFHAPYFAPFIADRSYTECVFPWTAFNANLLTTARAVAFRQTALDVYSGLPREIVDPEDTPATIPITRREQFDVRYKRVLGQLSSAGPAPRGCHCSRDGLQRGFPVQVERAAIYAAALTRFAGANVVDYGCGVGWGTELIAQHCPRTIGIDIDREITAYNQRTFRTASFAVAAQVRGDEYPCAVMIELLEHLPDPVGFLRSLAQDRLFLSVPDGRFYPLRAGGGLERDGFCPGHLEDYAPDDVLRILSFAGFAATFIGYPTIMRNELGPWHPSDFGISKDHSTISGPSALFYAERIPTRQ